MVVSSVFHRTSRQREERAFNGGVMTDVISSDSLLFEKPSLTTGWNAFCTVNNLVKPSGNITWQY